MEGRQGGQGLHDSAVRVVGVREEVQCFKGQMRFDGHLSWALQATFFKAVCVWVNDRSL